MTESPDNLELSERARIAEQLPFFLRAWWMKEHQESADLDFQQDSIVTCPLSSLYSDPFCDAGCIDYQLN
jgi:hypothetical protein